MSEAVVAVRGETVLDVPPEIATVVITLESQDKDRGRVLASLDERHRALIALLDGYQASTDTVDSSAAHVQPQFKDEKTREKLTGHLGMRTVTVTVTDFSVLGDLLGRAASDEARRVDGPFWSLRTDTPVVLQARTSAVHDAVRRARAYAGALGGTITELREIADTGLSRGRDGAVLMRASAASARAGGFGQPVVFDVTPVLQTVRGSVEARFTMTGADLSLVS